MNTLDVWIMINGPDFELFQVKINLLGFFNIQEKTQETFQYSFLMLLSADNIGRLFECDPLNSEK